MLCGDGGALSFSLLVDGGASGTTCHDASCLHDYKPLTRDNCFSDAGKKTHKSVGEGYLRVAVCIQGQATASHFMIHSYHTPTIPIVVLFPGRTVLRHSSWFNAHTVYTNHTTGRGYAKFHGASSTADVKIPGIVRGVLLYAQASRPAIIAYVACSLTTIDTPIDTNVEVNHIAAAAERVLWHQRLGHVNPRKLGDMHNSVKGIPKISMPSDIDKCMTCWICKIRRSDRGSQDTRQDATVTGQGISMDWGFICHHSKTNGRYEKLAGMHNESAYLIIADHYSDLLWGFPSDRKCPPLKWLNRWLSQYAPRDARHKYCCMDQGGELANNKEITALILLHGYVARPTGGDASHQNAPVERPHQTIGHSLRTMLYGAGLPFKFCPYAFHHYIMLHNVMPHGDRGVPVIRAGGPIPYLGDLRTFGCRVVVRPPGPRPSKLETHANVGNFLGYTATRTQAHYFDTATKKVKTSAHVRYDEGMCDSADPSSNARQLCAALGRPLPAESIDATMPKELDLVAMSSPFTDLVTLSLKVTCDDPCLGFVFGVCAARSRAFIVDIKCDSTASRIKDWRRKYWGAYIVEIDKKPVFSADDASQHLCAIRDDAPHRAAPMFTIVLAPDVPPTKVNPDTGIPHLQMAQIRTAISALYELG
jgi:hypothetical protein